MRLRLGHNANQRLGTARAHQDAAAAVELLLGGSDGVPNGLAIVQAGLVVRMHVDEYLRVLLHDAGKVGEGAAGALEHGQQLQGRHQPVTGGVVLQEDDVAGLLATDDGAIREHALKNIAVAHGGLDHLEALLLHCDGEAQVAHNGRDDLGIGELAASGQVGAADGKNVVAIDLVALAVHEQHAIGVAVVGQADVGVGSQHELAQGQQVVLQTKDGYFLRFAADEVSEKKKGAIGVRGIKLRKEDELEHVYLFEEGTETKVMYKEKEVTLNRLKMAKRDGTGTKTRA